MLWHIYTVTNTQSGKQYVGIAVNLRRRWRQHIHGRGGAIALSKWRSKDAGLS